VRQPAEDDLFGRVARAMRQLPRDVELDADLEKATLTSPLPDGRHTLALVLSSSQSVAFYSVWPQPVPRRQVGKCTEYVTRANTGLSTAVLEFDPDSGILAARSGIRFGDLALVDELSEPGFVRLLWLALLEAEQLAAEHLDGVAALLAGASVPDALQSAHA
jgi:hypothetical protein